MALDKNLLTAALKTAFDAGLDDPDWSAEDAAKAIADAIDTYVRSADVTGITTDVTNPGGTLIGQGTQTGFGGLS